MVATAFYVCMALIFIASVPIWRSIYSQYRQNKPLLESRPQLASPMGLIDLIVLLSIWLTSQILAVNVFSQISGVEIGSLESVSGSQMMVLMLIAGIAQMIAVALGMAILILRYKDVRVAGWYANFVRTDLKLAFVGFLLAAPVVLVLQTLLSLLVEYKHPAMDAMVEEATPFTVVAVWLAAVVAAPIGEEIVFRGWIQNWLQRVSFRPRAFAASIKGGWYNPTDPEWTQAVERVEHVLESEQSETRSNGSIVETEAAQKVDFDRGSNLSGDSNAYAPTIHTRSTESLASANNVPNAETPGHDPLVNWTAIVVTSLIFALMHLGQGLAPIPLFGFSLLLGFLYQRTGSLLPCISLHMLNNGYSVFWLTMQILTGETGDLP
jgi:membrane protease YdiL (CAAX protease family)